jgi:hypothetical protein
MMKLDKESIFYADIFDTYRLALKPYKFTTTGVDEKYKTVVCQERREQQTKSKKCLIYALV